MFDEIGRNRISVKGIYSLMSKKWAKLQNLYLCTLINELDDNNMQN